MSPEARSRAAESAERTRPRRYPENERRDYYKRVERGERTLAVAEA